MANEQNSTYKARIEPSTNPERFTIKLDETKSVTMYAE
jgi:hypothetical protein